MPTPAFPHLSCPLCPLWFHFPNRRWQSLIFLALCGCLVAGAPARADETPAEVEDSVERDYSDELPRIPPLEPHEALDSFQVHQGFRIEQVAAEPLVHDPVAMAFDGDGRLYVVEMRGYSEDPDDLLDRVVLLEDTDGDGQFDKSTVFLDGLSWPTAVICYDGGVFIGVAPDILYAKDHSGDGRADEKRVVFTGFGRSNVQGLLNSFQWGLDNRIHGATSSSGGEVRRADASDDEPIVLRGRDFAFDPRTLKLEATSGGAQHGLSFDDWGRKFVCHNSDHIQLVLFEDRYIARNPYLAAPGPRKSIASDGPQAEVYRISPVEPWRIVRTRLRLKGVVPGAVEGGGRAAGYFTGATGTTIYRGDAWPREYLGNAFVGDVGSNIVHRKVIEPAGVELVAHRADAETEFVASRDIWFRPAQFAGAPDGTLYVADVYREVIEHPDSLPPVIKKHLDLTSGRDRGRIYRVVPDGFEQPPLPRLSQASTEELVALLEHPGGWCRDTAARLLYERQDRSAIEPLMAMANSSESPLGRLHAIYALDGLDALTDSVILGRLVDEHPGVRRHATRLAERLVADSPTIRARLVEMVDDPDLKVRYQLAFSLGEFDGPARNEALAAICRRDAGDSWVRLAVLSSLARGADDVFATLMADRDFRRDKSGRAVLEALANQIGLQNEQDAVAGVLKSIEELGADEGPLAEALLRNMSEALAKSGSPLGERLGDGKVGRLLEEMLATARTKAADDEVPLDERVEAIRSLGLAELADVRPVLEPLLDHRQPQPLQAAALAALDKYREADVAEMIVAAWPGMSPRLRSQATEMLFARSERLPALVEALESGDVALGDVDPARLRLAVRETDGPLHERLQAIVESLALGRRQDVVEAYRAALEIDGDAERGREVFKKNCASCHRLEGIGHEIAPNLAAMQNRGPEAIMVNVLDPNREVNPQYVNYLLVTGDGRSLTGIIAAETATSVTLRRADNETDTILRIDIDELQSTGLSLMPEGMEKQIDPQAMADLIAYLMSVE